MAAEGRANGLPVLRGQVVPDGDADDVLRLRSAGGDRRVGVGSVRQLDLFGEEVLVEVGHQRALVAGLGGER